MWVRRWMDQAPVHPLQQQLSRAAGGVERRSTSPAAGSNGAVRVSVSGVPQTCPSVMVSRSSSPLSPTVAGGAAYLEGGRTRSAVEGDELEVG